MADAEPAPSGTAKRLTEAEWAEAKSLYELGKATKVDLSKKFGVSRQAITEGLSKRGAVYGCRSKEVEASVAEGAKSDSEKRAVEISEMKDGRKQAINLLAKLQNKIIGEALRDSKPIDSKSAEIRTLNTLIKNAAIIRSELWAIHDLNRDPDGAEDIPEFIVSEYEPDEIRAINNQRMGISPDADLATLVETTGETGDVEAELDELMGAASSA